MTAHHTPNALHASAFATHVFDLAAHRATHVFDPVLVAASPPTLGYTLAGSPNGEPAARRSPRCV